ncbi:MAG: glycine cleavage system protein GcvH [Deltaproteobacteria bacterium]|nr:glycine cleavage system protein GcvH [Deltaproteobacteria bacterium]
MEFPEDLLYTEQHEWALVENNVVTVGVTDFAQNQLGDVVYLDLPTEGDVLNQEDTFGVIESVKAVSDLYSPVSGKVIEVNTAAVDSPEIVNDDPYGEGWLVKIKVDPSRQKELEGLLDAHSYEELVSSRGVPADAEEDLNVREESE